MSRVEVEKKVLNENQIIAEQMRERYRQQGILCVNLISAPGSGKTLLLEKTLERMAKRTRVAVLTGDLQTENDAQRLAKFGFPVKQIRDRWHLPPGRAPGGEALGRLEAGRPRFAHHKT